MGLFDVKSLFFAPSSLAKIRPFFAKFTLIFCSGLAINAKIGNARVLPIASRNGGTNRWFTRISGDYFSLFGNFLKTIANAKWDYLTRNRYFPPEVAWQKLGLFLPNLRAFAARGLP